MNFLSFLRSAAILAIFVHLAGCANPPTVHPPPGVLFQTGPGDVLTYRGSANNTNVYGVKVGVPSFCAGKMVYIKGMYRTQGDGSGPRDFSGIHFDFEKTVGGETSWAPDWRNTAAAEWTPVSRQWPVPINGNMTVRAGVQASDTVLEMTGLSIYCR